MKRRTFLEVSAGMLALSTGARNAIFAKYKDPMQRIGMSTVMFRTRPLYWTHSRGEHRYPMRAR